MEIAYNALRIYNEVTRVADPVQFALRIRIYFTLGIGSGLRSSLEFSCNARTIYNEVTRVADPDQFALRIRIHITVRSGSGLRSSLKHVRLGGYIMRLPGLRIRNSLPYGSGFMLLSELDPD